VYVSTIVFSVHSFSVASPPTDSISLHRFPFFAEGYKRLTDFPSRMARDANDQSENGEKRPKGTPYQAPMHRKFF
jgi:hypothetical protein